MSISLDEVRHVAQLARLELDESEVLALQGELNSLLGHLVDISQIKASLGEPVTHAVSLRNIWAEDIVGETLGRDNSLRNAALVKAGLFVVPAIIED